MTMIEADFLGPPPCHMSTLVQIPCAQSIEDPLALHRFAEAEAHVRKWAQEQGRRLKRIADVRAEIASLTAEVWALEVEQRDVDSSTASAAKFIQQWRLDSRQASVRLRLQILHMTLYQLVAWQSEELRTQAVPGESQVASPAMGIWQHLIDVRPTDVLPVPTQLALAQELLDAGVLFDLEAELAWAVGLDLASGITRRIARDFFFEEVAAPFVSARREKLSMAAARVRTLAARRMLDEPSSETGSAAAIAKRLNPLGAPPHFA